MKTFTILKSLQYQLMERVKVINNKMKKYGDNKVTCNFSEPYVVEDKSSRFYNYEVVDVELDGNYQIANWEFIGTCEYDESVNRNLIKTIPGEFEIPTQYYTSTSCDHCNTNHRRKYTVLLRHTISGEYKQVGKSCLKDYIGVDITGYASYLASFDSLEEYAETLNKERFSREPKYFEVRDILLQTIARVEDRGYISKKMAELADYGLDTTASDIYHMFNQSRNGDGELILAPYTILPQYEETVDQIIEFINSLADTDSYIWSLQTILAAKHVQMNNLGLTVSMVGYYLREMGKKERDQKTAETSKSNYVGEVGERIVFTGTPECVHSYETDFGITRIYKFVVGDDVIIWKTSKYLSDSEVTLKATIKDHKEFRGVRQTEVTRARVTQ